MTFFRFSLLVVAAILLPHSGMAQTPRNWSQHVSLSGKGAYVIGDPAAKNRLIEYVSYTCGHCADFVRDGTPPLKAGWVRPGMLAVEVRNLIRDRYDLTAALLARCGGAAKFAGNHEAIFTAYDSWIDRVRSHSQIAALLPQSDDRTAQLVDIADKTGLTALMAKRGISPAQSRVCLADEKAVETMLAMTRQAIEHDKVSGTPGFLLNGKLLSAHSWAALRPMLPAPAN